MDKKNRIIIKNSIVIVGDEMELSRGIDILIKGDLIQEVGTNLDTSNCGIVDGSNYIICPSFTNAHIHLDDCAITDIGIGQNLEELVFPGCTRDKITATSKAKTKVAIRETIEAIKRQGTGFVCSFCENGLIGANTVKECLDVDVKTILVGRFKNKYPYEAKVEDLLKTVDGFAPGFIRDISKEELKNISQKILHIGGFVAMHSLESKGLPLDNFYKAVDYLDPRFLVHLIYAGDQEIDYLKNKNIGVVCCPRGNSITGVGFPPILKLLKAGITVALGTDNVFLNSPDMFREMEYTSRFIRGSSQNASAVTSKTVLQMATINGAKILDQEKLYGSITAGKKANFILFNKRSANFNRSADYISTIVNRAGSEDIAEIYLNGKPVLR